MMARGSIPCGVSALVSCNCTIKQQYEIKKYLNYFHVDELQVYWCFIPMFLLHTKDSIDASNRIEIHMISNVKYIYIYIYIYTIKITEQTKI